MNGLAYIIAVLLVLLAASALGEATTTTTVTTTTAPATTTTAVTTTVATTTTTAEPATTVPERVLNYIVTSAANVSTSRLSYILRYNYNASVGVCSIVTLESNETAAECRCRFPTASVADGFVADVNGNRFPEVSSAVVNRDTAAPTPEPSATHEPTVAPRKEDKGGGSNTIAIVMGVIVAVGAIAIILGAVAVFLKHRARTTVNGPEGDTPPPPVDRAHVESKEDCQV